MLLSLGSGPAVMGHGAATSFKSRDGSHETHVGLWAFLGIAIRNSPLIGSTSSVCLVHIDTDSVADRMDSDEPQRECFISNVYRDSKLCPGLQPERGGAT
jgi:hypothetical protein